jgi:hypothetical protein
MTLPQRHGYAASSDDDLRTTLLWHETSSVRGAGRLSAITSGFEVQARTPFPLGACPTIVLVNSKASAADGRLDIQGVPSPSCNPKVRYSLHKSPPLNRFLSPLNSVRTLSHSILILSSQYYCVLMLLSMREDAGETALRHEGRKRQEI